MRYLIDTHTFIWFVENDAQLSDTALAPIIDPRNDIFLSMASAWEMAIKVSIGRLKLARNVDDYIRHHAQINNIYLLDITLAHIGRVATLPFHHRDPFDRILVAQSLQEVWPLISRDANLDAYQIQRFW